MSALHELPTGITLFDGFARLIERLSAVLSALGTGLILGVMMLITADVIGRTFFAAPLSGTVEMVAMSILAIVFLQIAHTTAQGKLTRSEAFLGALSRRNPRVSQGFDALLHALGAALVGMLTTAFWPLFLRAWSRDEMVGTVGQFLAPKWPVYGIVALGAAMMALILGLRAIALALRAYRGETHK